MKIQGVIMQSFEKRYNDNPNYHHLENDSSETYSYQGNIVTLITVFKNGNNSVAIVEDENGEQFEVYRDQLY
jgi:hypothetical protein